MGDEQDSWFKQAFGVDLGQAAAAVQAEAAAVVAPVVERVEAAVAPVVQQVEAAVAPAVERVEAVVAPVVEKVEAVVAPVVAEGQALVEQVETGVTQIVKEAREGVEPVLDQAIDGAKAFGEKVLSGVGEALKIPGLVVADFGQPAVPLDGDTPAPGAGTPGPDPTFVDVDRTFPVLADNPIEFIAKANQFMGQDAAAHMETDTLSISNATLDAKNRVVTSGLVVRTTTKRPSWSGGRTIGDEKAVILQAEALIKDHEERHRQIMKSGMASAVAEMRGKPGNQADGILTKWIAKVEKDQNALDAREGKIVAIQGGGKITGVQLVPR